MTPWLAALLMYLLIIVLTLIPVVYTWISPVKLHPGGPSFDESTCFSADSKKLLSQNYERIRGALGFWKHEARKYEAMHIYCMLWLIVLSISVPVLSQAIQTYGKDDTFAGVFLTIATTHIALVTSLHKFFKVEQNFKAFRLGESEFYDTYRRLLDSPTSFGKTEPEQIDAYFEQVRIIRKGVRSAETDTYAGLEELRQAQAVRQNSPR
jgi:Protein of unknown function (DUF4231)